MSLRPHVHPYTAVAVSHAGFHLGSGQQIRAGGFPRHAAPDDATHRRARGAWSCLRYRTLKKRVKRAEPFLLMLSAILLYGIELGLISHSTSAIRNNLD
jgi:hypothetical protein